MNRVKKRLKQGTNLLVVTAERDGQYISTSTLNWEQLYY